MDGSLGAVAQVSSWKGAECHSEHVIGTQVLVLGEGVNCLLEMAGDWHRKHGGPELVLWCS